MLKQFILKRGKILAGAYRTHVAGMRTPYRSDWWDTDFFGSEISDRATIFSSFPAIAAAYHYATVETIILRELSKRRIVIGSVCDLGSGAGHWLDFYRNLGATSLCGIDVSAKATAYLSSKYGADAEIRHGRIIDQFAGVRADIVSAIGVMFHIVDDAEWSDTIGAISSALNPGGLLVVGGHFGWLDGVNVQFGSDGAVNKRLRSARHWRSELRRRGFADITIRRNYAYLSAPCPLPENNVLFAVKA